jgi:uncharacterized membrane protein YdbT with pleckstrin-like domain
VAIKPELLTGGESVIVDTRSPWKAILWPAVLLVLVVVAAPYLTQLADNTYVTWVAWIIALAVLVTWSIKPFLEWLTATCTITAKRLITREGLISRRGHDIPDVERVQHQLMGLLGGLHHRDSGRDDDA